MDISPDYRDLLKLLNKHKVRYLIAGAYAVIYYTQPRYTKDMDILAEPAPENAKKLYEALVEFGAPLKNISIEDFTNEKTIYQIGLAPVRVDIIMRLSGLKFKDAWKRRKKTKYGKVTVNVMGLRELIYAKRRSNRPQDVLDLKKLTRKI